MLCAYLTHNHYWSANWSGHYAMEPLDQVKLQKHYLGFSLQSSCQINGALTFISCVNNFQHLGHVKCGICARTSASLPRPLRREAGILGNQSEKDGRGAWRRVKCRCRFVSHVRHSGAGGRVCVERRWGEAKKEIFPIMRKKKTWSYIFYSQILKR